MTKNQCAYKELPQFFDVFVIFFNVQMNANKITLNLLK